MTCFTADIRTCSSSEKTTNADVARFVKKEVVKYSALEVGIASETIGFGYLSDIRHIRTPDISDG